jgi:ATP-dependent Clp protease ATP-binding subunit ClpA
MKNLRKNDRRSFEGYKKHHGIEVEKTALPECVRLAKRYAKGKKLPDAPSIY